MIVVVSKNSNSLYHYPIDDNEPASISLCGMVVDHYVNLNSWVAIFKNSALKAKACPRCERLMAYAGSSRV